MEIKIAEEIRNMSHKEAKDFLYNKIEEMLLSSDDNSIQLKQYFAALTEVIAGGQPVDYFNGARF